MKAVILAAGEGRRMLPLTLVKPKPLLEFRGKPILDHLFDEMPEEIDVVVMVVKYLGHQIKAYLGDAYRGKKIRYAEGSEKGSAFSFLASRSLIDTGERFFILQGDEPQQRSELKECLCYDYSWVCSEEPDPRPTGRALINADGIITEIVELSDDPHLSRWSAMGTMLVNTDIFEYEPTLHPSGEYRLPSLMSGFIKDHPVRAVFGKRRPPFSSPGDLNWIE